MNSSNNRGQAERWLEHRLRETPLRELRTGARQRLEDVMRVASAATADATSSGDPPGDPPVRYWWSRRIPLWQAAAACLAVFAFARLVNLPPAPVDVPAKPVEARTVGSAAPRLVLVRVDPEVFGLARIPAYQTDVSRWSVLDAP